MRRLPYRIRQVLDGKESGGPLPADWMEYLELLRKNRRQEDVPGLGYVVDGLRKVSRILEPHQQIDPTLFMFRTNEVRAEMAAILGLTDGKEIVDRVHALVRKTPKGIAGFRARSPIYKTALDVAPRVTEEFARELLPEVLTTFDALIGPADPYDLTNLLPLLERALFVAAHFDSLEHVHALVARFKTLLKAMHAGPGLRDFDLLAGQCFRGLRKLGMRDEVDQLLGQTAEIILAGRSLQYAAEALNEVTLRPLLHVAAGWLYFGRDRQAEPILQAARTLLFKNELLPIWQTPLACAYVAALGQAPVETAQKRLEVLFARLRNVRDVFVTHKWYLQSQLRVIEAVVLAVVSDDFTLGSDARRWLDDDEYLVRRRVHGDYRAAAAHA